MDLKYKKYLKNVVFCGIMLAVILFIVLAVLAIVFLVLQTTKEGDNTLDDSEGFRYRFFRYSPEEEIGSHGIVSIGEELTADNFISYQESSGNIILISQEGHEEYKCTGSCYCENERRTTSALVKPMMYLVAAASSTLALYVASNSFQDECVKEYSGDCIEGNIRSKVDTCENVFQLSTSEEESSSSEANPSETSTDAQNKDLKQKYMCEGRCFERNFYQDLESLRNHPKIDHPQFNMMKANIEVMYQQSEKYGCQKIHLQREIFSPVIQPPDLGEEMHLAKYQFATRELTEFCTDRTYEEVILENKWGNDHNIGLPMCGAADKNGDNHSVKCFRIE